MIYFITAIILYASSLFLYQKSRVHFSLQIPYIILAVTSVVCNLLYIVSDYFTGTGLSNAIFFHIGKGISSVYSFYIPQILAACVLLATAGIFLAYSARKAYMNTKSVLWASPLAYICMILSLLVCPGFTQVVKLYAEEKAESYMQRNTKSWIKEAGTPKNLVFIYAESLEDTYSNTGAFPGLTPNLDRLKARGVSFSNVGQGKLDWFTVGGMVASLCGVSLTETIYEKSGKTPEVTHSICVTDLLKKFGYTIAYRAGADIEFAGKGSFLGDHSFDSIEGVDQLVDRIKDKSRVTTWGLYDEDTFELVYEKFTELAASNTPFALFSPTLDTHGPAGYPSQVCSKYKYQYIDNRLLDAVHCSDALIGSFVDKILSSPYAENTVVVIASDHLAMKGVGTRYIENLVRRNRFLILAPGEAPRSINTKGTTRDIGTTILPYIGFTGEIGLGKNLESN